MSRPVKTIQLSNCKVNIITYLTWGEKEKIQSVFLSGAKLGNIKPGAENDSVNIGFDPAVMLQAKYALLEVAVIDIIKTSNDAEMVEKYSKEWMDNLTQEDGDMLYNEVEEINKKK